MKRKHGNMWDVFANVDLFCITTNSTIKTNGALVMGAGIAKAARDKWPGLDLALGKRITQLGFDNGIYGFLYSPTWPTSKLAAFQVKTHWNNDAEPSIIHYAATKLSAFAIEHPSIAIALNYPGIGNGRLDPEVVVPFLKMLPDNVQVWAYPDGPKKSALGLTCLK